MYLQTILLQISISKKLIAFTKLKNQNSIFGNSDLLGASRWMCNITKKVTLHRYRSVISTSITLYVGVFLWNKFVDLNCFSFSPFLITWN